MERNNTEMPRKKARLSENIEANNTNSMSSECGRHNQRKMSFRSQSKNNIEDNIVKIINEGFKCTEDPTLTKIKQLEEFFESIRQLNRKERDSEISDLAVPTDHIDRHMISIPGPSGSNSNPERHMISIPGPSGSNSNPESQMISIPGPSGSNSNPERQMISIPGPSGSNSNPERQMISIPGPSGSNSNPEKRAVPTDHIDRHTRMISIPGPSGSNSNPERHMISIPGPSGSNSNPERHMISIPGPSGSNSNPERQMISIPGPSGRNSNPERQIISIPGPSRSNSNPERHMLCIRRPSRSNSNPERYRMRIPRPSESNSNPERHMICIRRPSGSNSNSERQMISIPGPSGSNSNPEKRVTDKLACIRIYPRSKMKIGRFNFGCKVLLEKCRKADKLAKRLFIESQPKDIVIKQLFNNEPKKYNEYIFKSIFSLKIPKTIPAKERLSQYFEHCKHEMDDDEDDDAEVTDSLYHEICKIGDDEDDDAEVTDEEQRIDSSRPTKVEEYVYNIAYNNEEFDKEWLRKIRKQNKSRIPLLKVLNDQWRSSLNSDSEPYESCSDYELVQVEDSSSSENEDNFPNPEELFNRYLKTIFIDKSLSNITRMMESYDGESSFLCRTRAPRMPQNKIKSYTLEEIFDIVLPPVDENEKCLVHNKPIETDKSFALTPKVVIKPKHVYGSVQRPKARPVTTKANVTALALLECGIEKDAKDSHGRTPLSIAMALGNAGVVKALLDFGAGPIDGHDKCERTLLMELLFTSTVNSIPRQPTIHHMCRC